MKKITPSTWRDLLLFSIYTLNDYHSVMTHNKKHIKEICKILSLDECEENHKLFAGAMNLIASFKKGSAPSVTMTKDQKKAARKFADVLFAVRTCLNDPNLAADLRVGFPSKDFITHFMEQAREADRRELPKKHTDFAKQCAADHALWLMNHYGRAAPRTRGGDLDRLAGLLYGAPLDTEGKPCESLIKYCFRRRAGT